MIIDFNEVKDIYENAEFNGFIFKQAIYAYQAYLQDPIRIKKYKSRTISEAINELNKFDKFLKYAYPELVNMSDLSIAHFKDYNQFCLKQLKNSRKTVNKKIRALKQFFAYLKNYRNLIEINPTLEVKYLQLERESLPGYIEKDKLNLLLSILHNFKYGVREVCITKFMGYFGLKLQEVFSLSVDSVNICKKEFTIKRNSNEYTFPIPDSMYVDIKEYMALRTQFEIDTTSKSLFLSHTGCLYNIRAYQYKFKAALIQANIEGDYTPRNVRASFCYYMAKETPQNVLKAILNQGKVEHYYINEIAHNPLIK